MKSYIEQLVESLGLPGTSYSGIANLSPDSIASAVAGTYGIDQSLLPSHLFSGFNKGLFEGTYGKTYSPIVQAQQNPLIQDLTASIEGHKGKRAFGGFAGSQQGQDYMSQAKDVYGQKMSGVLADVGSSVSSSEQYIIDYLNSIKDTALGIRYGNV